MLLIYTPSQFVSRFISTTALPAIAETRDNAPLRAHRIDSLIGQTLLMSMAVTAGFALVGPFFIPLLFGEAFRSHALIVAVMGAH